MPPKIHRRLIPLAALAWLLLGLAASGQVTTRSVTNAAQLGTIDPRSVSSDDRAVVVIGDPTGADQGTFVYSKTAARPTNSLSVVNADTEGQFLRVLPWQDDLVVSHPFHSAQAMALTNLWSLGDSHTAGQVNIAGSSNWLSGGYIIDRFRYPNILATRWGMNLTNLAVSGSAVSCGNNGLTGPDLSSSLWQISQLGPNWRGTVTLMHGYNDGYLWQDSASVLGWFESAQAASLAALLATNWAGASGVDWTGNSVSGWSTGGSVQDEGAGSAGKRIFPSASTLSGNRISLLLASGQSWSATLSGRVGLVLERSSAGGVVAIKSNSVVIAQIAMDTQGNGYAATARRLPVLHTLTLPAATTVGIESLSGTNSLLGVVWIGSESDALRKRVIVSGGTPLGDYSIRSDGMISAIGSAAHRAAARFRTYPVWTAFAGSAIDPRSDVYSSDPSHPGPSGHVKFADGFEAATRATAAGAQLGRAQIAAPFLRSEGALEVFGGSMGQDYSRPRAVVSFVGGYGTFIDSLKAGLNAFSNIIVRASHVAISQSGLSVLGSSGAGALPQQGGLHFSYGSGESYIDSYNYLAASFDPVNYRAANHRYASAHVSISGATADTADIVQVPALHFSFAGGAAYVDSYDFGTSTYKPLYLRALSHRLGNGHVSISGATTLPADILQDAALHLSFGGGVGRFDSYRYSDSTWMPMQIRGSYIELPTGPVQFSGGIGSGYGTAASAVIFADVGTAHFRAAKAGGYMAAAMDGTTNELRVSGAIRATVDGGAANDVSPLSIYDARNGTLKRINIGAVGSGPGNGRALYLDGVAGDAMPGAGRPTLLTQMTTATRDGLGAVNAGAMIWNTTTSKAQVYTGSAWVDLH